MLKQTLVAGLMSLGFIVSTPAMAHSSSGNYESISPAGHGHYHQPRRHCVSGKKVDGRQANQKAQIRNGVNRGKLVFWEKKQLNKEQRHIRKKERHMRSDGCLTKREVKKLMNLLNSASNNIHALKSNRFKVRNHRRNHNNNHHNRTRRNHR